MKTQDIKNMGRALQQVQESSNANESYGADIIKAAKMYMKDSSCSYKKAAEAYGCSAEQVRKCAKEMYKKENKEECPKCEGDGCDHCDNKGYHMNEALKGDQHKLDRDDDGDIDAADFKALRNKKKKGEKSKVKPSQATNTDKANSADVNMEKKESRKWEVYNRIMEKRAQTAGATAPEEMDSKDSTTAKKMKTDHKPEVNDTEELGHTDAVAAGRKGPAGKARPNDNMKGDKKIVNPVKGAE